MIHEPSGYVMLMVNNEARRVVRFCQLVVASVSWPRVESR